MMLFSKGSRVLLLFKTIFVGFFNIKCLETLVNRKRIKELIHSSAQSGVLNSNLYLLL